MILKEVEIFNCRSFLSPQIIKFNHSISIITGPNSGGKTNTLDIISTILRQHVLKMRNIHITTSTHPPTLNYSDSSSYVEIEKHFDSQTNPSHVKFKIQPSRSDITNMQMIKQGYREVISDLGYIVDDSIWKKTEKWNLSTINENSLINFEWAGGTTVIPDCSASKYFLEYLDLYHLDQEIRKRSENKLLQESILYLPAHRASGNLHTQVNISEYDESDSAEQMRMMNSKSQNIKIMNRAISQIAKRYIDLNESGLGNSKQRIKSDSNLKALTQQLLEIGYEWDLKTIDQYRNIYEIDIIKNGKKYSLERASSGEKELFTYLFSIHALGVKNAVIFVDEAELHLHPAWQHKLIDIFENLAKTTGNQFIVSTHSPSFIRPSSIQYVCRVYLDNNESRIAQMPHENQLTSKQLINIVTSQNNEKMMFSKKVVLVEGISDKIIFDKLLTHDADKISVVNVGGKTQFQFYNKILDEFNVPRYIVADLDYLKQIGSTEIKAMFTAHRKKIDSILKDKNDRDSQALIRKIEDAITHSDVSKLADAWEIIKIKGSKLHDSLDDSSKLKITQYIEGLYRENTFILKCGEIEDYMPNTLKSKDIDKLIDFLSNPDWTEQISEHKMHELQGIADHILQH